MPQNPPLLLRVLVLDLLVTLIRISYSVRRILILFDHWVLALIVHHDIAWVICLMMLGIGEPFTAHWRLKMEESGDDKGDKAFVFAVLAVSSLWFGILAVIIGCEFVGFLVWACVYFVAVQFGLRPPRLLPLIERLWLALGYDLMSLWRSLMELD